MMLVMAAGALAFLATGCGAAAQQLGTGTGSGDAPAGRDPTSLDPCAYITDQDLAAAVQVGYGSSGSQSSTASATPTDTSGTTPTDTSTATNDTGSSGSTPPAPSDWQFQRVTQDNPAAQSVLGYSKKECHLAATAIYDSQNPQRLTLWEAHVYFAPASIFDLAHQSGATPVTVEGADRAEQFSETVTLVKNAWTVVATTTTEPPKEELAMLSGLCGRLPS